MKNIVFLIVFSIVLNANVDIKIKNILGTKEYSTHKNLINHIFKDKNSYYAEDGLIDYIKISQKLKNNNLLKLRLASVQYLNLDFNIKGSSKKSIYILKNILLSLGYYHFKTSSATRFNDNFKWSIKLKSKVAIDPLRLSKALFLRNIKLLDISKGGYNSWTYTIDTKDAKIHKANDLEVNNSIELKKSKKPYMIKISNASAVLFNSKGNNMWHPNIVFYDEDFNILEIFKEDSLHKSLKLEMPVDTKYIKIDDIHTLVNLKQGMEIIKE